MLVDCIHSPVACKMIEQDMFWGVCKIYTQRGYGGMTE